MPENPRKGGCIVLTRRRFAGFAPCAICATAGFIATGASAQIGKPITSGGITRTTLSQLDGPVPGYTTINMLVEIAPRTFIIRHMHPGIESTYVLAGGNFDPSIQGEPSRIVKAGDAIQVPAMRHHAGVENGDVETKLVTTYVVEKGKPLVIPVKD